MATKKMARKKAKGGRNKPRVPPEPGEPIIIGGGSRLIRDKKVSLEFDHNAYGPDDNNPPNWLHEDCKLQHIDADEIGVPPLDKVLAEGDSITIKCANGAQNSDIEINGGPPLVLKFKRGDYPYKKRKHNGAGFQISKILVNGRVEFTSNGGECHIKVKTRKP